MRIDPSLFDAYKGDMMLYPRLMECINGYNNKIGSLQITYVLCKHYLDLGIPDERWYVSPSLDGKNSIQYDPDFAPEHYMRRFWFNHFAENLYVTVFGVWDSLVDLLNMFYGIDEPSDLRLRSKVMEWLKKNKRNVYDFLDAVIKEDDYKRANDFRTQFVHGFAPSQVSNQNKYIKNTTATVLDSEATKQTGKAVFKQVPHAIVMTLTVGDYTPVKTVMGTFEKFASLTATKKEELINLMLN